MRRAAILLVAALGTTSACSDDSSSRGDVTGRLELVGNPLLGRYPEGESVYARNPWDLQAHAGRLFVGGGNSSNEGPAVNAGPVPLVAYDPQTEVFVEEATIDDEQVDVFHVLDGVLQTGGHDPLEGWQLGNVYVRDDGGATWTKLRTVPRAIHTYAMTSRDGALFAGLGTPAGATVAVSTDGGQTWDAHRATGYRVRAFLDPGGEGPFATGIFDPSLRSLGFHAVAEWTGAGFDVRADLGVEEIFPGASLPPGRNARVVKPVAYDGVAVYLGGVVHNDHQYLPLGLYSARSLARGAIDVRAHDPAPGAPVWDVDVDVHGDRLLALVAEPSGEGWLARVLESRDLSSWEEVFHFETAGLPRSLEVLGEGYYVGLGCEVEDPGTWTQDELLPATGELWRVR